MSVEVRSAPSNSPSYFLVSISTQENLDLCIKYGLAGFPSGESGAWTFCEVREGDFVSFLYGARVHNLYRVARREAIKDADHLPPWRPLTFKDSGKTYSFPFRLYLEQLRQFTELIVRTEFLYVAENLLLRGGYRKTHFQADQTTLQSVSQMGAHVDHPVESLHLGGYSTFVPRFTRTRRLVKTPETCRFQETILQSAIRQHLSSGDNLGLLLSALGLTTVEANRLEVLGEKALPQGHIDLLLKDRVPLGSALKVPIEVKTKRARAGDLAQLRGYMDELRGESPLGVLVAADFGRGVATQAERARIKLFRYRLDADLDQTPTFDEICQDLTLESIIA
jgi:hypothetical protein